MEEAIGTRVAQLIHGLDPAVSHKEIARRAGMTPDAFSRALNGKRGFASVELARIADILGTGVYWLITGEQDPNHLVFAARHDYDRETRVHSVPSRESDQKVIGDIHTAYRQAFGDHSVPTPLSQEINETRSALGTDFARQLIQRIERNLEVDVIRMAELGTAYSFTSVGRRVIAIPATGNWFRENWSLAHELGHLAGLASESRANAFAAGLLLPESEISALDWQSITTAEVAEFVWNFGVSTDALLTRLQSLATPCSSETAAALTQNTQRLLRRHWSGTSDPLDQITRRMDEASTRRFPASLQEAHQEAIAGGKVGPSFLAWMLGVDPETLELDVPQLDDEVEVDGLARSLGLSLA